MPKSVVAKVVGGLFAIGFAVGALGSPNPLTRVGCGLALMSIIAAITMASTLSEPALGRVAASVTGLMMVAFIGLFVATHMSGGGALNGTAENGRYFLGEHGHYTQVGRGRYYLVAAVELAVFSLFPLGITLVVLSSARDRGATDAGRSEERGRRTRR